MTPKLIFTLIISTMSPKQIIKSISTSSVSTISMKISISSIFTMSSHNRSYIASIIHIIIAMTIWSIITTTSGFIIPNTKCRNICPFSWAFPPQRMCRYITTTTCSYIPMYISTTTMPIYLYYNYIINNIIINIIIYINI